MRFLGHPHPSPKGDTFLAAARAPSRENSYQLFSNTLRPLRYLSWGRLIRRFATYLGEGYLIFGGEGQGEDEAVGVGGGDVAGDDFTSMDEKVCVYLTVIVIVKQLIGIASDLFVLVF